MPFSKSHPMLWNTVVLSYGSLVYRYCTYEYGTSCPVAVVQVIGYITIALLTGKETKCISYVPVYSGYMAEDGIVNVMTTATLILCSFAVVQTFSVSILAANHCRLENSRCDMFVSNSPCWTW